MPFRAKGEPVAPPDLTPRSPRPTRVWRHTQDFDNFREYIVQGFVEQMPTDLPTSKKKGRWGDRPWSSGEVELLPNIGPCAQRYAHFYFFAGSDALTESLDEDGVRRAARALYSVASACNATRQNCREEGAYQKAGNPLPERRAHKIPENWHLCGEELRVLYKWNGAAADPEIAAHLEVKGDGNGSAAGGAGKRPLLLASPSNNEPARCPARSERERKAEEDGLSQALAGTNEAITTMVSSISKRAAANEAAKWAKERSAAAEYFNSPEVRDAPEAKEFSANLHQEMVLLGRSVFAAPRQRRAEA